MLSFEEFFIKKNIDLTALKADRPALYEEFMEHYEQMGEKSFDHTKKYWFNKLRMDYKLPEVSQITIPKEEESKERVIATPAEETPGTPKPTGFKPRFKSNMVQAKKQEEKTVDEPETPTQAVAKPTGFKPRFKANTTPKEESPKLSEKPKEEGKASTSEQLNTTKPTGFKPRFKAGVTNTKLAGETDETIQQNPSEEVSIKTEATQETKPLGFKPRFKAGVTSTKTTEKTDKTVQQSLNEETESKPEASKETKSLGFKPRFKAGVTKGKPKDEE